ncbi:hypothetical protein V495_03565 [Pseudogymnoascus sp. VKM F-4514 (FW-929)]|nr:hypothetical protein V495_03565 [Pseudogymnoascus sp. VKM F-4514 (FW-929)]KFY57769.1 hypothetical protein V497_05273 [Pseudogymnoascus sp. VKM F-4516 (FW-969)]
MKISLISALLAATATALPQGLGQISRIVITDAQPTAIAVPRNADPQHLGPVSRTVIYDSKPTILTVPRNAEPQRLGPVSRTVIYDSKPTSVLHVPRNDAPSEEKRQSIGGICTSNDSCGKGFLCTPLGGGYTMCLPDFLLPSVVQSAETASRTNIGDTPVSSGVAIQPTNVALADRA